MKAQNHKRKLLDDQLQYGQQKGLADALHARLDLPLAHRVNAGDVIHPLDAVKVALVDGVDAYKTGTPIGLWRFACPDGIAHGVGLGESHPHGLVARAFAQVVQVRDRDTRQPPVARIAIDAVSALQEVRYGRATDILIGFVHFDEQFDIERRVFARKRGGRCAVALRQRHGGQTVSVPMGDQAGDLRAAVAAGVPQVSQQYASLALGLPGVVKALEHAADVLITLDIVPVRREFDLRTGAEKLLDLFNRTKPCFVHVDHHPCDDQPTSSIRPQILRFRLIPRWKYSSCSGSYHIGQGSVLTVLDPAPTLPILPRIIRNQL